MFDYEIISNVNFGEATERVNKVGQIIQLLGDSTAISGERLKDFAEKGDRQSMHLEIDRLAGIMKTSARDLYTTSDDISNLFDAALNAIEQMIYLNIKTFGNESTNPQLTELNAALDGMTLQALGSVRRYP